MKVLGVPIEWLSTALAAISNFHMKRNQRVPCPAEQVSNEKRNKPGEPCAKVEIAVTGISFHTVIAKKRREKMWRGKREKKLFTCLVAYSAEWNDSAIQGGGRYRIGRRGETQGGEIKFKMNRESRSAYQGLRIALAKCDVCVHRLGACICYPISTTHLNLSRTDDFVFNISGSEKGNDSSQNR